MRKAELDYILKTMLDSRPDASDLIFTVGKPPQIESSGRMEPVSFPGTPLEKLTPFQTETLSLNLINSDRRLIETLISEGSCDLSYELQGKTRFRVNIFSQRGSYSIVLRKLSADIPTIAELKIPDILARITEEKNGLVLVTGATGSGKSTTLAAVLRLFNETQALHIITLEDPVEFSHPHIKATFNQREMGTDFDTFANGLRSALRQSPKVILVGEMRDRETVEIGLSAAETGHLVLTTLHTIDAGQTINRIIGMFEQEEEKQIRNRLADTLRWVVSQRLLPRIGGGRIVAVEIMKTNIRVKDSIVNGESEGKTFYEIIDGGDAYGMQTFDKAIINLYREGQITEETAMTYASRKPLVVRAIDAIKSAKGEKTTDIEGLKLDKDYDKRVKNTI